MPKRQIHKFSCSQSIRKIKNKVTDERREKAQNEEKTEIIGLKRSTKVLEKKEDKEKSSNVVGEQILKQVSQTHFFKR